MTYLGAELFFLKFEFMDIKQQYEHLSIDVQEGLLHRDVDDNYFGRFTSKRAKALPYLLAATSFCLLISIVTCSILLFHRQTNEECGRQLTAYCKMLRFYR